MPPDSAQYAARSRAGTPASPVKSKLRPPTWNNRIADELFSALVASSSGSARVSTPQASATITIFSVIVLAARSRVASIPPPP